MESRFDNLTPDAARYLLGFKFTESNRRRMQDLPDKPQAGILTEDEERRVRQLSSHREPTVYHAVRSSFGLAQV